MKQSYKIIIALVWGLIILINPNTLTHASDEEVHEDAHQEVTHSPVEHAASQHGNEAETHHEAVQHDEHANSDEHGGGGGHGGGGHHFWWLFPGHEIFLSAFSCIYFALFIIVIARFFAKDLGGHH